MLCGLPELPGQELGGCREACESAEHATQGEALLQAHERLQHLGLSLLDMPDDIVTLGTSIMMDVVPEFSLYTASDFLQQFNVEFSKMGFKANGRLLNEHGVEEYFLIFRTSGPRKLVLKSRMNTTLCEKLMREHIRDGQPRELFNWARADVMEKLPPALKRKHRLLTVDSLSEKVEQYFRKLKKGEEVKQKDRDSESNSEGDSESDDKAPRGLQMPSAFGAGPLCIMDPSHSAAPHHLPARGNRLIDAGPKDRILAIRDCQFPSQAPSHPSLSLGFRGLPHIACHAQDRRSRPRRPDDNHLVAAGLRMVVLPARGGKWRRRPQKLRRP